MRDSHLPLDAGVGGEAEHRGLVEDHVSVAGRLHRDDGDVAMILVDPLTFVPSIEDWRLPTLHIAAFASPECRRESLKLRPTDRFVCSGHVEQLTEYGPKGL